MVAITNPIGTFARDLGATIAGLEARRGVPTRLEGLWLESDQQTVLVSLAGEEERHRIFFAKPLTLIGTQHGY